MDRSIARLGSWAGWISLVGILGYHVALVALAGERVSGTVDVDAIRAYHAQPIVASATVEQFLVILVVAVFGVALREALVASTAGTVLASRTRTLAGIGLVALIAELPVILVVGSAQAAIVVGVEAGEPVVTFFRFWDVLYNSALYGLEATWVLAFGLAVRALPVFPRLLGWLAPLVAALLLLNVFAIWVGIPDSATLPASLGLSVWLAAASVGLGRLGRADDRELAAQPA